MAIITDSSQFLFKVSDKTDIAILSKGVNDYNSLTDIAMSINTNEPFAIPNAEIHLPFTDITQETVCVSVHRLLIPVSV